MTNQYSKQFGPHSQFPTLEQDEERPETIVTQDVSDSECRVYNAVHDQIKSKSRKVSKWECVCGEEAFRVFASSFSTVAQCISCGNEKLIHEG